MTKKLINGKKINVIQMNPHGQKTIVMIHGLFTNLSVYYFLIAPKLAKKYHVILYDLSGHGLSEMGEEPLSLKNLTDDLLALMLAFNVTKASLVGYSFGGLVALYAAAKHSHLVEKLMLIDVPRLNEKEFEMIENGHFNFETAMKKYSQSMGIKIPSQIKKSKLEHLESMFGGGKLNELFCGSRLLLDELELESLCIPTLLLYGKKSPYLKTGKYFSTFLPNARLRFGKGDHNLPVQSAPWVYRQLKSFMKAYDD